MSKAVTSVVRRAILAALCALPALPALPEAAAQPGGKQPTAAAPRTQPPPPPQTPPPAACLPGAGPSRLLRLQGDALQQCLDDDENDDLVRCFATDLRSGKLSQLPTPPFVRPLPRVARAAGLAPAIQITEKADSADFCRGKDCKTLHASDEVDPGLGINAAADEAGELAALAYLSEETTVEIFDLATGKRLSRLRGRKPQALCIFAELIAGTVLVRETECGSDGVAASWLASSATGKRLATAGGAAAFATSIDPAHLSGDDWAFPAAAGEAVVIQDVKTGKLKKRIALGARSTPATPVSDGKRLVLAYEGARRGDLAVIDLATYKVRKLAGTRCPAAAP